MGLFETARSELQRLSRSALHLTRGGASQFSKLGGIPLVPPEFSWPVWKSEPLAFLAQLDLSEVAAALASPWMPTTGALYFFYDKEQSTWGFDPADLGSWRVVYSDTDRSSLTPAELPSGIGADHVYAGVPVAFRNIASFPDLQRLKINTTGLTEAEFDDLIDMILSPFEGAPSHQLFGFPTPVQADDMELECQLASNGVYCGTPDGYRTALASQLSSGANDWRLLLQLDSDDAVDMMWGDLGRLYFWVRESDARMLDFTKVWMILQCS